MATFSLVETMSGRSRHLLLITMSQKELQSSLCRIGEYVRLSACDEGVSAAMGKPPAFYSDKHGVLRSTQRPDAVWPGAL